MHTLGSEPNLKHDLDVGTQAYLAVRDAILTGEYVPGEQLKDRDLSQRFGFSRTAVRDALKRLAAEGFATARPHVGVFVRKMSIEEQKAALEYRIAVESGAAVLAARYASDEEISELEALGAELDGVTREKQWEAVFEREPRFHSRMIELAHNDALHQMATTAQMVFWTYTVFYSGQKELFFFIRRNQELTVPHAEIARAIGSRDPGKASVAVHDHLMRTVRLIEQLLEEFPNRSRAN